MNIGMPAGLSQPERIKWLLMQARGLAHKRAVIECEINYRIRAEVWNGIKRP